MQKAGNNNKLGFFPQSPQPQPQDHKLFPNKLVMSNELPSFRVLYYGGASGSIPFTWESQPGTPKHISSDTSLPPLTPPPSYQSHSHQHVNCKFHSQPKRSKSTTFLRGLFSSTKSSSHSFSWSSSSASASSMNWPLVRANPHFVRSRPVREEEEEGGVRGVAGSFTSTLCFGVRDGASKKYHGRRRFNKPICLAST